MVHVPAPARPTAGRLLTVTGVVQGVGFRPFVHRLAARHGLAGRVRNGSDGVRIHLEGHPDAMDAFAVELVGNPPFLARIDGLTATDTVAEGLEEFTIETSAVDPVGRVPVSPDVAICDACLAELADPADRRYRYPFITCTDCGPRFTLIESMPYDRERTSMRAFPQCPACSAEYRESGNRRYHSETNSCPECGPRVWFEKDGKDGKDGNDGSGAKDEVGSDD